MGDEGKLGTRAARLETRSQTVRNGGKTSWIASSSASGTYGDAAGATSAWAGVGMCIDDCARTPTRATIRYGRRAARRAPTDFAFCD